MLSLAGLALAALVSPSPTPQNLRAAVEKALPLLAKGAAGHAEQKTCFACHNQALPMIAFAAAREHGFKVSDDLFHEQAEHIRAFLTLNTDKYKEGKGTGGQADTAGWALYTLYNAKAEADNATAAVVEYLLKRDANKGYWPCSSNRPPTEASPFTTTYLGIRALQEWGAESQKERITKRIDAVSEWLAKTEAKDTEDRVFKIRGLIAVEGSPEALLETMVELRVAQRPDGGWGQAEGLPSDPYATATAMAALRHARGLPTNSKDFGRGLAYLLRTQQADGSWYVKSRSKPFQPYYESGFPHLKNQFISISATAWATAVLAEAGAKRR